MNYSRILLVLVLVGVLACGFASAGSYPVKNPFGAGNAVIEVEVNDVGLDPANPKNLKKTEQLDVLVTLRLTDFPNTTSEIEDVVIEAELKGYDLSDKEKVRDETDKFDVRIGQVYDKRLKLELPVRFDQGFYNLKIRLDNEVFGQTFVFPLQIDTKEHLLQIRDIVLNPENEVEAGRALLAEARIKNRGEIEEEDVKVKVSIPALGISASNYIDELNEEDCDKNSNKDDEDCDDSTTSKELYMRIPDCTEPGEYTLRLCVEYDDGDEEVCETKKIRVVESDTCVIPAEKPESTGKTIITIGPETQDVAKGGSALYPVTLTNDGSESKAYSISIDSADWAEFSISPSNILVVGAGESKSAYISLKDKSKASGTQVFSVTIRSGESILKQVPLKANIAESAAATLSIGKIKGALQVGLVVLIILLVILGLIIGFNKMKGSEDEEEKGEEKAFY